MTSIIAVAEPLRTEYARSFRDHFDVEFYNMEDSGEETFTLSTAQLDEWLVKSMLATYQEDDEVLYYAEIPAPDSADWKRFSGIRNKVRTEMNKAAAFGRHGHPAFRVDATRGTHSVVVRSLASTVKVSAPEMAASLTRLIANKQKTLSGMNGYMMDNLEGLPPALQGSIRTHQRSFDAMVQTTQLALNIYISGVMEDYDDAKKLGMPAPSDTLALENE